MLVARLTCPLWARFYRHLTYVTCSGRAWPCASCGRPVDLDRHTARGGPRGDQFERPVPAGVREQPRALADDHRAGEQAHLVDKVVVEQPPEQCAAAVRLPL